MKVEYITHSGSDLLVVNAARVSTGKHKEKFDASDEKLLSYLMKNEHRSPFYHPSLTVRIEAPIFVVRQVMRHVVGMSYNEISGRYVEFEEDVYEPEHWRMAAENVKQGSSDEILPTKQEKRANTIYRTAVNYAFNTYKTLLSMGIAKEQARMVLPLSLETQLYATGTLWAWLWFLKLRLDSHAQAETRQLADEIRKLLQVHFPVSTRLFMEKFND